MLENLSDLEVKFLIVTIHIRLNVIEWGIKMKFTTKYVIFAFSLLLTFSLILKAYSDDDHYKKRYRYRGGHQKVDDDKKGHDNNDHLKPVTNQTYNETCGGCHFAYQPELLPSASWLKILNQLDDHFGEEIETDSPSAGISSCLSL